MNFLNKAKNQANKTMEVEPSTLKVPTSTPGTRPQGIKPPMPKSTGIPGSRPMPGARPGIKPTMPIREKEEVNTVEKEVEKTTGPVAKNNPFKLAVEKPIKESIIEPEINKEEIISEINVPIEDEIVVNDSIEVETIKEKKTVKTKSKSKAKKAEKAIDESSSEEDNTEVIVPKTEGTYSEAVLAIKSTFVDEEWELFKKDTSDRLCEIQITSDMTPAALKHTISDLNALRDSVWLHFLECKTFFETLTAKDDGLLDRIKRLNSKGSNDNERKINAAVAIMNYKENGKSINLYEVLDASRARFNYTKGLMESIQYKSNAVITMLGNLKLEK